MSIPLYTFEFALIDFVGLRHALHLEREGYAKVIRHRKGMISRVVLYRRACNPRRRTTLRDYVGQAYSFAQPLDDGRRAWIQRISSLCAGINRHVVGDERALQERSSEPS